MGKIKAIFSDIDGTLLNSNHQITEGTKEIIKKVVQNQTEFILISARMPSGMKAIYDDLEIQSPLISYNGALILKNPVVNENNKILYSATISSIDAKKIWILTKEKFPTVSFNLFSYDEWLVENIEEEWTKQESQIIHVQPKEANIREQIELGQAVHKILCMGEPEVISKLESDLNDSGIEACWYRSKDTYLEITSKKASKVLAIKALQAYFAIEPEEMLAIGDNYNDLSMIDYAGIGIAMGNAPQPVKAASDFVTRSNDQEGLKWALEKFVQS